MDLKEVPFDLVDWVKYHKNLDYLVITGIFYFLIAWAFKAEYPTGFNSNWFTGLFIYIMLFMPGITFSLITYYINPARKFIGKFRVVFHLICSMAIYYGVVVLFVKFNQPLIAGSLGSLLSSLLSRFIFAIKYPINQLLVVSVVSGIVFFVPINLLSEKSYSLGISVLLWIVINGQFVSIFSRTYPKNQSIISF